MSRGSTTSVHTPSAHPRQQNRQASEPSFISVSQAVQSQAVQYNLGEMETRTQEQLPKPNIAYAIDPTLRDHRAAARAMSLDHAYSRSADSLRPLINRHDSLDGSAAKFLINFNDEQTQDDMGISEIRKKKGSASSIANDQELKRLFAENKGRDLKEVASAVLQNDRGPRSEKTKQIFAMIWLYTACRKSTGSVRRDRVFSHYARRCGTERVPPLNPASFGKLVRIIFPGILTRRLGMRGESKYHYVELDLIDDQLEGAGIEQGQVMGELGGAADVSTAKRQRTQLPTDTAVFPLLNTGFDSNSTFVDTSRPKASTSLYLNNSMTSIHQGESGPKQVRRQLKFSTGKVSLCSHDEPIELPPIHGHLPVATDPDAANTLVAIYRTHCISVIDSFRFCKERMFWHHFTSFHGTLTVPVQKLLAHPSLAAWIRACDWHMYQRIINFVSPLALQVMPQKVLDTFRSISEKIMKHICTTFQNHPQHVRDAKIGPATVFAGLIDRLLRVNATAHAAANVLTNNANRDQMYHDWICFVKPNKVVEASLPGLGYTRTIRILLLEIRELLGPLSADRYQGMQPMFTNAMNDPGYPDPYLQQYSQPEMDDSSTAGVLDRWTTFLNGLPARFPECVDARDLLLCVDAVGSAALRDITMAQALSFGSWWVTKVWVDEMLQWMAEKGGFLETSPTTIKMRPRKRSAFDAGFDVEDGLGAYKVSRHRTGVSEVDEEKTRYSSVDVRQEVQNPPSHELNGYSRHGSLSLPTHNHSGGLSCQCVGDESKHLPSSGRLQHKDEALPQQIAKEGEQDQLQNHDDSGIGLDLDLPQHDTPIRLADYGGFITNNVSNSGSDPADVVVC